MRTLLLIAGCFLAAGLSRAFSQTDIRPGQKEDQISLSVQLSWNVRAAITKYQKDQRLRLYKVASVRLTQCSVLFGLLGRATTSDPRAASALNVVANAYYRAGGLVWTGSTSEHDAMFRDAGTYVSKLRNNEKDLQTFLRGCEDLGDTEEAAFKVISAWVN